MSDNALIKQERGIVSFAPTTFAEAMTFSAMIARSEFAPKDYKGKPESVFLAIQMGAEVGLAPMQALQNIAVINGRPSIWGDAALALVQNHPAYEWHKEFFEGDAAVFQIKRRGNEVHEVRFSTKDAKQAGLLNKPGPWTNYPERMKQWRARGFGLRDKFADALKGLITAEEAQDYQTTVEAVPVEPQTITDGTVTLTLPTGDEPIHREGFEHPAKTCAHCLNSGVPKDCTATLAAGHIYIRRGEKAPIHDLKHKSHVYCPACKEDAKKEQVPASRPTDSPPAGSANDAGVAAGSIAPAANEPSAKGDAGAVAGAGVGGPAPVTMLSEDQRAELWMVAQNAGYSFPFYTEQLSKMGYKSSEFIPASEFKRLLAFLLAFFGSGKPVAKSGPIVPPIIEKALGAAEKALKHRNPEDTWWEVGVALGIRGDWQAARDQAASNGDIGPWLHFAGLLGNDISTLQQVVAKTGLSWQQVFTYFERTLPVGYDAKKLAPRVISLSAMEPAEARSVITPVQESVMTDDVGLFV